MSENLPTRSQNKIAFKIISSTLSRTLYAHFLCNLLLLKLLKNLMAEQLASFLPFLIKCNKKSMLQRGMSGAAALILSYRALHPPILSVRFNCLRAVFLDPQAALFRTAVDHSCLLQNRDHAWAASCDASNVLGRAVTNRHLQREGSAQKMRRGAVWEGESTIYEEEQ